MIVQIKIITDVDGAPGGPTEVYLDGVPVIFLNGGSGGRGASV